MSFAYYFWFDRASCVIFKNQLKILNQVEKKIILTETKISLIWNARKTYHDYFIKFLENNVSSS